MAAPLISPRLFRACELSMQTLGRFAIGSVGFLRRGEVTEVESLFLHDNARNPWFADTWAARYAFQPTPIVRLGSSIPQILRHGANAQIGASIVESVAINVIHDQFAVGQSKNKAMHRNLFLINLCICISQIFAVIRSIYRPPVIHNNIKVLWIDIRDCLLQFADDDVHSVIIAGNRLGVQ